MSEAASWPGGARAALSLSFDNLGEAAELELGAPAETVLGGHVTAARTVPGILDALESHRLQATFFVEGLNTQVYPDLLGEITARGHEVAYHAWRHEDWGALGAAEQAENLARGSAAFRELGLDIAGLRPPGGGLGEGGLDVVREAGLHYCSPAGEGVGTDDGVALLPFQWRHVDATCLLPPLASVRERMTGSTEPLEPGRFLAHLESEVRTLTRDGGFATIVLHPITIDSWFGERRLDQLLARIAEAKQAGELWVAPCRSVALHALADVEAFDGGATLDSTSWA